MREFFRSFSFPGGIGSHCTPETPGSIHEGGELGYALSHAFGAAFDNPDLHRRRGGRRRRGRDRPARHRLAFATSSSTRCATARCCRCCNLNGYKINNPTRARAHHATRNSRRCCAATAGRRISSRATTPPRCTRRWPRRWKRACSRSAASRPRRAPSGVAARARWPMIVLRTPQGLDRAEGRRRSPRRGLLARPPGAAGRGAREPRAPAPARGLAAQLPAGGTLRRRRARSCRSCARSRPRGTRRMSANPHANGGLLRKRAAAAGFPRLRGRGRRAGRDQRRATPARWAAYCATRMRANPHNFRVFGPDETASNKLDAIYEVSRKTWLAEMLPEDADGGELAADGRVMEMLSRAHARGLARRLPAHRPPRLPLDLRGLRRTSSTRCSTSTPSGWRRRTEIPWRAPVVLAQPADHLHGLAPGPQRLHAPGPGFPRRGRQQEPAVTRIYLPPDANCAARRSADHCLRSTDYVNVIVADKQKHLQYLDMDEAIRHCTKGIGIWDWASNDEGGEPDVVMASCGDIATRGGAGGHRAAARAFPDLKIRFVNVVDLFKLRRQPSIPHGLTDREFDSLFTRRQAGHLQFPRLPLAHPPPRLPPHQPRQPARARLQGAGQHQHAAGAGDRQRDRPLQPGDRRDRPRAARCAWPARTPRSALRNRQIDCRDHAHEHGIDPPEIRDWSWPGP